ncbi:MAG: hypothetical protein PHP93_06680 [Kiritimatiellales bacterium]|nr:hypothetical protein [Kiritimatiellales bacterium]
MVPYEFGFDPNGYDAMLALHDELKALGRNVKALAKKVSRRVRYKTGK